jgi:hypothetical protein
MLNATSELVAGKPCQVQTSTVSLTHEAATVSTIESSWLDYAWQVFTDQVHIRECELAGGTSIEDPQLRWPGYLGARYEAGGLLLVANIHRDFAPRVGIESANRLIGCTRAWREAGRSVASDREYLDANRACYIEGLQRWNVGKWFSKFISLIGIEFDQVAYLNAARCQAVEGACQPLQRLCLRRFPIEQIVAVLQPSVILTTSLVVFRESRLTVPIKWFNQRNGIDDAGRKFSEWSVMEHERFRARMIAPAEEQNLCVIHL